MGNVRLGVLDIGSNTVHLLVVDAYYGAAPIPAHSEKIELKLSEHIGMNGQINKGLAKDLIAFVQDSLVTAENLGVTQVEAFATSAIREAANGPEVLDRLEADTGVKVALLPGDEEARLTFLAIRRWYGWSAGRLMVLDIGGGSLEMAVGDDEDPEVAISLPLGAGRLTRSHLPIDPPDEEAIRELRRMVRVEIANVIGRVRQRGEISQAVASSKTFRQLARISGAAPYSDGPLVRRTLALSDLQELLPRLAKMSAAERAELPGVSPGRAGQLVAGAVVAEAAMELFEISTIDVCPWALREGVILRHLDGLRAS